jgi:hypothetical protein
MSTPQDPFRPPPEQGRGAPWQPGWGQTPSGPTWGAPGQPPPWPGGRPPFGTAAPRPTRNGLGTAAVVLGLLSLPAAITVVGGALAGLLAVVLGVQARTRVRTGEADNSGAATAGIVLGCLGLAATVIAVVVWVSVLRSDTGQDLVQCLSSASDQAAVEQCQRQFEDELTG